MTDQILLEHHYKGETPLQTLRLLFRPDRYHVYAAIIAFLIKHTPVWMLPVLTANMIDVVVQHEDISILWRNAFILLLLLFQNIPMHVLYMRELSIALRRMETRLRSALARQLQRLSIGYYTHASAGVLQTKVVRDVEAIEQMVRQLFDGGLGALSSLVGALVITALRAPAFLPFFVVMVPVSAVLVQTMRKTLTVHNQRFRTEVERMREQVRRSARGPETPRR